MVILTIKFSKGSKTYDYLMRNPDRIKIDRGKPLKTLLAVQYGKVYFQELTLVDAKKVEVLPSHVTSSLLLLPDNEVKMYRLSSDSIKALRCGQKAIEKEVIGADATTPQDKIPDRPDPNWTLAERLRWAAKRYKI